MSNFPPSIKDNCTPLPYAPCSFRHGIVTTNPYTEWTKRANVQTVVKPCVQMTGTPKIQQGTWSNFQSHHL